MQYLLTFFGNSRTIASQVGNIAMTLAGACVLVATYYGGVTIEGGLTLGALALSASKLFDAMGAIFQRLATQSVKEDLAELPADFELLRQKVADLEAAAKLATPAPVSPFDQLPKSSGTVIKSMLILVALSSAAMAAQPVAIVSGPRTAEPGEEIILDLLKSEGEPKVYAWRVFPTLAGRKQLTILEGGKSCRLASYPGTYLVRAMVANDDGIDLHEHQVTIPGSIPCPAPDPILPTPKPIVPTPIIPVPVPIIPTPVPVPIPVPVPVPTPDGLPAGEFDGLPAAVNALALAVNSTARPAEAAKLADAFEAVAAQLSAGTLKNPVSIVSAIATAFNGTVTAGSDWDKAFREKSIARMRALYDGGKLATPDRWAAMLREVSLGLRAIK